MQQRPLGHSGLMVSLVGLGCNNFGGRLGLAETQVVVDVALDLGITLFDTADIYGNLGGSEELLGAALGARRKDIVLATKFGQAMDQAGRLQGASRRYIVAAVEASLQRLKTDWIDLYQLHVSDPATPIEETLRALDDLVRSGKVRYAGCSRVAAWEVTDAFHTARHHRLHPFISNQDEYSLLVRDADREMIPAMQAAGCGFLPYRPLASGLLSGKYRRGAPLPEGSRLQGRADQASRFLNDRNWDMVERLEEFCRVRGRTLLELAVSWILTRPTVASVIAGATSSAQLRQNVDAAQWDLSKAELDEIDRLTA
jgi:aryl-alcohol dehydrogenase-like predicted oxidoreductase